MGCTECDILVEITKPASVCCGIIHMSTHGVQQTYRYYPKDKQQEDDPEVKGRMVTSRLGIGSHMFITVSMKTHCDDLRT